MCESHFFLSIWFSGFSQSTSSLSSSYLYPVFCLQFRLSTKIYLTEKKTNWSPRNTQRRNNRQRQKDLRKLQFTSYGRRWYASRLYNEILVLESNCIICLFVIICFMTLFWIAAKRLIKYGSKFVCLWNIWLAYEEKKRKALLSFFLVCCGQKWCWNRIQN